MYVVNSYEPAIQHNIKKKNTPTPPLSTHSFDPHPAGDQHSSAEVNKTASVGATPSEDGPLLPVLGSHPDATHALLHLGRPLAGLRLVCHRRTARQAMGGRRATDR